MQANRLPPYASGCMLPPTLDRRMRRGTDSCREGAVNQSQSDLDEAVIFGGFGELSMYGEGQPALEDRDPGIPFLDSK